MLKIGITGGIGAGKSLICALFRTLGIPIYDADKQAKWIINNDEKVKEAIIALLGDEAYNEKGEYNTVYVSQKVFGHKDLLHRLNKIVHPAVAVHSTEWTKQYSEAPYVIREAALLFESGAYQLVDKTILVYAPIDIRIKRVQLRDGWSESQIRQRIQSQWPEEQKMQMADHIIINDGSQSILRQVWQLHLLFTQEQNG
jgi:dephospho-CoA kinase